MSLTNWRVVEYLVQKANCSGLILWLTVKVSLYRRIFLNIFDMDNSRDMGG